MKKWYESKTLIANSIAIVIFAIQQMTGIIPGLTPEIAGALVAVMNIFLRFVTTTELTK